MGRQTSPHAGPRGSDLGHAGQVLGDPPAHGSRFTFLPEPAKTFLNETFSFTDRNAPQNSEFWKPGDYGSKKVVHLGILTPKVSGKSFQDVRIFL